MIRSPLLGAACLLLLGLATAEARTAHRRPREEAVVPPASAVRPVALVPGSEPACSRPRRRLWLPGEGWVVRRVAACR